MQFKNKKNHECSGYIFFFLLSFKIFYMLYFCGIQDQTYVFVCTELHPQNYYYYYYYCIRNRSQGLMLARQALMSLNCIPATIIFYFGQSLAKLSSWLTWTWMPDIPASPSQSANLKGIYHQTQHFCITAKSILKI